MMVALSLQALHNKYVRVAEKWSACLLITTVNQVNFYTRDPVLLCLASYRF